MTVAQVTEISATSDTSFEDAINEGVRRATATLRGVESVWVKDINVLIRAGQITGYKVNMAVTFNLDLDTTNEQEAWSRRQQMRRYPKYESPVEFAGHAVDPELVPLRRDADGVLRVAGTRVSLDTVVAAFRLGATAEEIAQQYPGLHLADVYAILAYYLRHHPDMGEYLAYRHHLATQVREENEARFDPTGIRARLLARSGKDR